MGDTDRLLQERATRHGGTWVYWRRRGGGNPIHSEFGSAIRGLSERDQNALESRVRMLMEKAEAGQIQPPAEAKEMVSSCGQVAELRIQVGQYRDAPLPFRLYYAEPEEVDRCLLALSFKRKLTDHRMNQQQDHVEEATRRLLEGRERLWGLPKLPGVPAGCPPERLMDHIPEEEAL